MTTYYIDLSSVSNGDGTEPTPYNALTNLPTLVAGDTVKIKRGSYQRMPAKYTVTASGTASAWITFEDYGTGAQPIIEPSAEATGCIDVSSLSYIRIKNLQCVGLPIWTSQATYGIRINGAGSNIIIENCVCSFLGLGIDLGLGFTRTNVTIINTTCNYNTSDGLRGFSASGNYSWDKVDIKNSTFNFNGRALGSNGSGISFYIQPTHTDVRIKNVTIDNCIMESNNKFGISVTSEAIAWTTVVAAGNTTAPVAAIQGLVISNNIVNNNKRGGIHTMCATYSSLLPFTILNNRLNGNSRESTLGNIWTGGCINGSVLKNVCIGALTNGTTVGDGQGIFDDQWNNGMLISRNFISSNLALSEVPEYAAYGIGIYRASNSIHTKNVIQDCKYGYVIGYVTGATAPTMTNILIEGNTFIDIKEHAIALWSDTPSNSLTFNQNVILRSNRDVRALSAQAGTQTWSQNIAYLTVVKSSTNNIPSDAWDHTKPITDVDKNGFPIINGNLYHTGTYTRKTISNNGAASIPPSIGAYEYIPVRGTR